MLRQKRTTVGSAPQSAGWQGARIIQHQPADPLFGRRQRWQRCLDAI
jgi:hypothetical protein